MKVGCNPDQVNKLLVTNNALSCKHLNFTQGENGNESQHGSCLISLHISRGKVNLRVNVKVKVAMRSVLKRESIAKIYILSKDPLCIIYGGKIGETSGLNQKIV